MVINIKKLLLILISFFLFNTLEVDSNSDKILYYNKNDIHVEEEFKVYLNDVNSIDLDNILKTLKIAILSYEIDGNKYYVKNIDELVKEYVKDKPLNEKIYYENKGIYIDVINIVCEVNELSKLQNLIKTY